MDDSDRTALRTKIYQRLQKRRLDAKAFGELKMILSMATSSRLQFAGVQGTRLTLKQAWLHYRAGKRLLAAESIVPEPLRPQLREAVETAGFQTAMALWEANRTSVAKWQLQWSYVPTGVDEQGRKQYLNPDMRVIARNAETGEVREALIPFSLLSPPERLAEGLERAYRELRIWKDLYWGIPGKKLRSARDPHAWPIYTHLLIPQLYGFLRRYYPARPRYSEKRDSGLRPDRPALYDSELNADILELLRAEFPHDFKSAKIGTITSAVQQYLRRSAK